MLAVVAVVAFASGKACEESLPKLCACKGGNGQEYQGEVKRTNEGVQCMDWIFAPNPRYRDLPGNYCRNTSNSKAPWCYTEGSDWAYCDIPECGCDGYDPKICGCEELDMADYRGTLNTTVGGQKCQSWSEQYPNRHYYKPDDPVYADEGLDANYCRNPYMDADKLWCYLADKKGWDYCEPRPCGLTTTTSTTTACKDFDSQLCGCSVNNQADYRGTINVSQDGDECQRWDSQYPNRHIYDPTSSEFANEGLDENYCRNPDGEGAGPWCYLNDIDAGRWKLCDVTPCDASTTTTTSTTTTPCMNFDSDVCGCSDNNMSDYRGTINKSESGLECQRWDSQVPNQHNYYPSIYPELEENYCRSPEGSERPWCYTTSVYRYDYCDIPACDVTTTTAPTTQTAPTTTTNYVPTSSWSWATTTYDGPGDWEGRFCGTQLNGCIENNTMRTGVSIPWPSICMNYGSKQNFINHMCPTCANSEDPVNEPGCYGSMGGYMARNWYPGKDGSMNTYEGVTTEDDGLYKNGICWELQPLKYTFQEFLPNSFKEQEGIFGGGSESIQDEKHLLDGWDPLTSVIAKAAVGCGGNCNHLGQKGRCLHSEAADCVNTCIGSMSTREAQIDPCSMKSPATGDPPCNYMIWGNDTNWSQMSEANIEDNGSCMLGYNQEGIWQEPQDTDNRNWCAGEHMHFDTTNYPFPQAAELINYIVRYRRVQCPEE